MNEDERRGFREGVLATRLDNHDRHFEQLNGSMEATAAALARVDKTLDNLMTQMTGMAQVMPRLTTAADDVLKAELVAETLKKKQIEDRSNWDRFRVIGAWGVGLLVSASVIAQFMLSHI